MLLFNLSDNSVRVLNLPKMWLMDYLSKATEGKLKEGLIQKSEIVDQKGLIEQLRSLLSSAKIKGEDCAFTLHDERSYALRLDLPSASGGITVSELIKERTSLIIPESFESLKTTYKNLGSEKKEGGEVQVAAVNRELLAKYLAVFEGLGLRARLAVPESYAIFAFTSPIIKEGETVIYLDPEAKTENTIIMDKEGVIETFTEQDQEKIKRFAMEKWGRKVERVFGPGNISELLQTYPIPLRFKLESAQAAKFVSLLGLALLTRRKEPLNLLG